LTINVQVSETLTGPEGPAAVDETLLEQAALATLQQQGASPESELTLVVSDDDQLHALNRQFLGIDEPTDVLSFPAGDTDPESDALYLGDVILSLPRARQQAEAAGHSAEAELQLLVVHGVLHLLGHDHAAPEEKAAMWAAQGEILTALGCPEALPPL
jgi:probable rRNA maturation factor